MPDFKLAPALAGSSHHVTDWDICQLRVHDDARYAPWLVLVPHLRSGLRELTDLNDAEAAALNSEIRRAIALVQKLSGCDKVNLGALGNVEPQLHIHILPRWRSDAAWPGPVWGHSAAEPYSAAGLAKQIAELKAAL